MSDDRQKLKALLLSEELAQLKAIHKLLNDKQQLTEKVSEVLDPAADRVIARNPDFKKKFSRIDPKSYVRAVKANKQTFIDALLPIIGPMIRKSVSSAIRRFVADVNRAVEMGISAKALKWRWKSFTTGVPFTEIVFNNTIQYQVQQVFLIDNHSGMLIEFAGHEEALLQDKDAMSAMLTAIQDFVKDAVSQEGDGLSAAELGDKLVWLIQGNKANIATVIKGAPTARLRDSMSGLLESIHLDFYHELEDQSSWNNSPELKTELEKLLLTKSQSDDEQTPKGINYWPWIWIILGLIGWFTWSGYQHRSAQSTITNQLNQTSGFVLQDLNYKDGQFIATGLKDPLATFDDLEDGVMINSTPYLSLEDEMVAKRVTQLLKQDSILVHSQNNVVTLTGSIPAETNIQQQLAFIAMMPGVHALDNQIEITQTKTLDEFLAHNPPPHTIQVEPNDSGVILSGITTDDALNAFTSELAQITAVDVSQVVLANQDELIAFVQANPLNILSTSTISEALQLQLDQIVKAMTQLRALQDDIHVQLVARSDCQGSEKESNENNQLRLQMVYDYMISQGLTPDAIVTKSMQCSTTTEQVELEKIGVWFEVLP